MPSSDEMSSQSSRPWRLRCASHMLLARVVLAFALPSVISLPPHNWDCIMCKTNTMLAGNWDIRSPNFNNTSVPARAPCRALLLKCSSRARHLFPPRR